MALEVLNCKPPGRLTNILAADSGEFTDQRVLVKADLNLDVEESGQVRDPFPLRQLIPLIKFLQRKGARSITLIGYRGEACGVPDEKYSLAPLKEVLETVLDQPVVFIPEGVSDAADIAIRSQEPGRVLLLENIRFHPEEIGVKELPGGLKIKVSYDALNDYRYF
uniref:Phosphoglycerate kinase n=1 Tax=Biomphalaria glabrata TaxID=6526 RepID=A0A2C9LFA5_BIOGL